MKRWNASRWAVYEILATMCCTSVPPGWFQGARIACASSNNIPFTCMCVYIYINISYIIHTTMLFCRLYACLLPELCTAKNGCWAYTRDILRWLLGKSLACSCLIPAHRASSYNLGLGRCVINGVRTNRQPQIRRDSKRCKTDHRMCYPQIAVEMWQQLPKLHVDACLI